VFQDYLKVKSGDFVEEFFCKLKPFGEAAHQVLLDGFVDFCVIGHDHSPFCASMYFVMVSLDTLPAVAQK
jgi:hypothetical protein